MTKGRDAPRDLLQELRESLERVRAERKKADAAVTEDNAPSLQQRLRRHAQFFPYAEVCVEAAEALDRAWVELSTLRDRIEALIAESQGSRLHGGGWSNGIVAVDDLAAALGIDPPGPPPPPTEAEIQELRDLLSSVREEGI